MRKSVQPVYTYKPRTAKQKRTAFSTLKLARPANEVIVTTQSPSDLQFESVRSSNNSR